MTTPAKPERMTEVEFAVCASASGQSCVWWWEDLYAEARRARSEEERLSRTLAREEKLGEALAHELGEQICARLAAEEERKRSELRAERDALREENHRLHEGHCLSVTEADPTECRLARPAKPGTWCVQCVRADQHLALVAELAAAREEAERLKAQIERMKEANTGTGGGTT